MPATSIPATSDPGHLDPGTNRQADSGHTELAVDGVEASPYFFLPRDSMYVGSIVIHRNNTSSPRVMSMPGASTGAWRIGCTA